MSLGGEAPSVLRFFEPVMLALSQLATRSEGDELHSSKIALHQAYLDPPSYDVQATMRSQSYFENVKGRHLSESPHSGP